MLVELVYKVTAIFPQQTKSVRLLMAITLAEESPTRLPP